MNPPDSIGDADPAQLFDWSGPLVDLNRSLSPSLTLTPSESRLWFPPIDDCDDDDDEPLVVGFERSSSDRKRISSSEAPSRRKKKLKSLPKRPLSAYNFFFQTERSLLMQDRAIVPSLKVGFEDLGRIVGKKWRELSEAERETYNRKAIGDSERYRKEMEDYKKRETDKRRGVKVSEPASPAFSLPPTPYRFPTFEHPHGMQSPPMVQSQQYFGRAPYTTTTSGAPFSPLPLTHSSSDHPKHHEYSDRYKRFCPPPGGPGICKGPIPSSAFPLRPNQEVLIQDQNGQLQKYRVQYAVMSMTEAAAKSYMEEMNMALHHTPSSRYVYHKLLSLWFIRVTLAVLYLVCAGAYTSLVFHTIVPLCPLCIITAVMHRITGIMKHHHIHCSKSYV